MSLIATLRCDVCSDEKSLGIAEKSWIAVVHNFVPKPAICISTKRVPPDAVGFGGVQYDVCGSNCMHNMIERLLDQFPDFPPEGTTNESN